MCTGIKGKQWPQPNVSAFIVIRQLGLTLAISAGGAQNSPLEINQLHQLVTNKLRLTRWLSVESLKNKFFSIKGMLYVYSISEAI